MRHFIATASAIVFLFSTLTINAAAQEDNTSENRVDTLYLRLSDNRLKIEPFVYNPAQYIDPGNGDGGCNWGSKEVIATGNGRKISFGYDYRSLMHVLYHGNKAVVWHPALTITNLNKKTGSATFAIGNRKLTVDLRKTDHLSKLKKFVAPQNGTNRQSFSYAYDCLQGGRQFPGCYNFTMIIDLPSGTQNGARATEIFFSKNIPMSTFYGEKEPIDTLYMPKQRPESLVELMKYEAIVDLIEAGDKYFKPLTQATMKPEIQWFTNNTRYVWPEVLNSNFVTWGSTINSIYTVGGGQSSETLYTTYDLATGNELGFEEIFLPTDTDEITEALMTQMAKYMPSYWFDDDMNGNIEAKKEYVEEIYFSDIDNEEWMLGLRFAIDHKGVILSYDTSAMSLFGEDGFESIVAPWSEISRYVRPEVLSAMGIAIDR